MTKVVMSVLFWKDHNLSSLGERWCLWRGFDILIDV